MSEIGYTPKNLVFNADGREHLKRGISAISSAVKSTLGPSGQTVLIESPTHTHGITVTKDGVTVAKAVELLHPVENLAVRIMKEAADRTATAAGDGTTTAIVLTEALVSEGMRLLGEGVNKTEVLRELVELTEGVVKSLKRNSRAVTKGRLRDVATISANNDTRVGKIIADVYKAVGPSGLVTVGKSQTSETYSEATIGLKIERGYSSNLFVNDQRKDECVLEDVHILVSDAEISSILQIENVLKPIITDGKRLLIIAPCSTNVVNTLAANVMQRGLKICVISPPSFGYKTNELMQDIAVSVGAKYFSEKTGDDLSHISFGDLGHSPKVVVGGDSTIVLNGSDKMNVEVTERVSQLRGAHDEAKTKDDKDFILSRIASLTGGVGVIYVGGKTDLEQKELYDRVDDAVCAVRSALEEGILPGGGVALYNEARVLSENDSVAANILVAALRKPLEQIWANADKEVEGVACTDAKNYAHGCNIKTNEWGDMYQMGVIDPLKVTKSALQNAVSVAVTLLSTNAIITMARTYEDA